MMVILAVVLDGVNDGDIGCGVGWCYYCWW